MINIDTGNTRHFTAGPRSSVVVLLGSIDGWHHPATICAIVPFRVHSLHGALMKSRVTVGPPPASIRWRAEERSTGIRRRVVFPILRSPNWTALRSGPAFPEVHIGVRMRHLIRPGCCIGHLLHDLLEPGCLLGLAMRMERDLLTELPRVRHARRNRGWVGLAPLQPPPPCCRCRRLLLLLLPLGLSSSTNLLLVGRTHTLQVALGHTHFSTSTSSRFFRASRGTNNSHKHYTTVDAGDRQLLVN